MLGCATDHLYHYQLHYTEILMHWSSAPGLTVVAIFGSWAMAEISVKILALFMCWRVFKACSQVCSQTDSSLSKFVIRSCDVVLGCSVPGNTCLLMVRVNIGLCLWGRSAWRWGFLLEWPPLISHVSLVWTDLNQLFNFEAVCMQLCSLWRC